MNNSAIIRDVGATLANVLSLGLKGHKVKAQGVVGPPQRAVMEKKAPCLGVSLLGIESHRYDGERPQEDLVQEPQSDGSIKEYFVDPPMTLHMEWMLTGWGKDYEEDVTLLGVGMKILLECPRFEKAHIVGDSFDEDDGVPLLVDTDVGFERRTAVFQSFGEPMRAAAFYRVPAILYSERRSPEVRRVITRHIGLTDKATGRRMR